jgi:peptidoglycan/xylan/chitin deacetylase (PgdA/CDA1 family)
MPMKDAVLQVMRRSGVFAPFRLAHRSKTLILVYHRFSADDAPGATSARAFAEQLAYLRARYTIVPLSALHAQLAAGRTAPGQVAITVDDGYRDFYEIAFPILQRYRAPATLFAVTDFIDGRCWLWTDKLRVALSQTAANRVSVTVGRTVIDVTLQGPASRRAAASRINEALKREADDSKDRIIASIASQVGIELPASPPPDLGPASWSELREMAAGGIEIGSHTVTHPIVTRVPSDRLAHELRRSRARLEEMLGRPVTSFAYPNGTYDRAARQEVERNGYQLAVTMEAGFNDAASDPLALRRIHTETDLARFVQSTSGFEAIKNRLRHPPSAISNPQSAIPNPQ